MAYSNERGTAMTKATFAINDRWRLTEDGALQWILEKRKGERWYAKAYCGTRAGLLEVALLHHGVAAPAPVLVALDRLPEHYEPGKLEASVLDRAA